MNRFELDRLLIFLPTLLPENTKPKMYDQIREKYLKENIWELQYSFYSKLKDIDMSGLLGCNDYVLEPLKNESQDAIKIANKLSSAWKRWREIVLDTPDYDFMGIAVERYGIALESIVSRYKQEVSKPVNWAEQVYF